MLTPAAGWPTIVHQITRFFLRDDWTAVIGQLAVEEID
jgi:hypothetical protein